MFWKVAVILAVKRLYITDSDLNQRYFQPIMPNIFELVIDIQGDLFSSRLDNVCFRKILSRGYQNILRKLGNPAAIVIPRAITMSPNANFGIPKGS